LVTAIRFTVGPQTELRRRVEPVKMVKSDQQSAYDVFKPVVGRTESVGCNLWRRGMEDCSAAIPAIRFYDSQY